MEHGTKLSPERSLRTPRGIKGTRQRFVVIHNPSEIGQNQLLLVRFPNLGSDDVVAPATTNLSFDIEIKPSVDTKATLVSNIGRAIVKKLAVKFEGNEILSIDDYDVFAGYKDLWKTLQEEVNVVRQVKITTEGDTQNCMKIRIKASDKNESDVDDKALANAFKNKFIIPLDFEMLETTIPYYQAGLGNRLCNELTFNNYDRVIKSDPEKPSAAVTAPKPNAS